MKNLYLIVGSAIVIGALVFLRKKKMSDTKLQAEANAKAEETLKNDFDTAVQTQAEAMNIDLINEKKAKALMPIYDSIWKSIFKLGNVKVSDARLIAYKQQLADIEKIVNDVGFQVHSSPRSASGSFITKK
jgi:hypothetical protein